MKAPFQKLTMLAISLGLLCLTGIAQAHPPSKIEATYNLETNKLNIRIIHDTPKPTFHYINLVTVKIRGKSYTYAYDKQTNKEEEDVELTFRDVAKGDKIQITGKCNIFGSKTITIVAGEEPKPKAKKK